MADGHWGEGEERRRGGSGEGRGEDEMGSQGARREQEGARRDIKGRRGKERDKERH